VRRLAAVASRIGKNGTLRALGFRSEAVIAFESNLHTRAIAATH
jgi:hypothetical protein